MAKTEDPPAIGIESKDMIEGPIKQGKARKFFLIYKGSTIKTLVVFKKGSFNSKVNEAKKSGLTGEVSCGVLSGSGKNLFFFLAGNEAVAEVMKVDSVVEQAPTKKSKLREFLTEHGLNLKPSYYVITDAAFAPDPESESDLPIAPPPPGSEVIDDDEPGESEDASPTNQGSIDPSFIAARDRLEPRFLEAKRISPEKALKLAGVWDYAHAQADAGNLANAMSALERLEKAIEGILAEPPKTDQQRFGIEEGIVRVTRDKLIESFKKTMLVWERTRDNIQAELKKLENAILNLSKNEEDYEDIQENSDKVYVVMDELDDELIRLLEEAAKTQDESLRSTRHEEARNTVQRYLDLLQSNDFLREVDQNPFATVKVRSTLETSLNTLKRGLSIRLAE